MNRLRPSQLWLSVAVLMLYAPTLVVVGDARFRGSWLSESVGPLPVSVWLVCGLMALLIGLAWSFATTAFDVRDDQSEGTGE